jgi:hypothetical protein
LATIQQTITGHHYFIEALEATKDTSFPYLFRLREDQDRRIALELMVFPFPENPADD